MKNVERLCKQDSGTAAFDCLLYRNLQDVDESYVYKNIWILYLKKSGFYFVLRVWRLGQNWAGKDGKKKKRRIRVYQNDLLKKIKLEKTVMACSYGIMEFGTLYRNLAFNWQQACLCFIVEELCDQHTIAAWNTPLFMILVRENSPGFQSPAPGFSFKSIWIVCWGKFTQIIEKQTPPSLFLSQKILTFFLNTETSSCSKELPRMAGVSEEHCVAG